MEIILAIVVASAVIFFGALISMGNEQQRKAIDSLRDQIIMWAIQDIQIKRERMVREIRIEDPIDWLTKIFTKVCGENLNLQFVDAFNEPQALLCLVSNRSGSKIVFSPLSPNEIHHLIKNKRNLLSRYTNPHPLSSSLRNVRVYEISVLNGGILFDLELPLVWKHLSGQEIELSGRLWAYVISSSQ